jgi:two-component system sensor histidine kinase BaeS
MLASVGLRWRIAGLFGGGALLLSALLTGVGITALAQLEFASAQASALESVQGAAQALTVAVAQRSQDLGQVVRSAARAAAADLYWVSGGRVVASSPPGPPPAALASLPSPAFPEAEFAVQRGTWLVMAAAPAAVPSPAPGRVGEVVLVRRLTALKAELTAIQRRLWTVGAAAALLFAAFGFALAHSIASPLERLTRAARRMSAGDLGQRVGAEGVGEVAALSRAFDAMADRLAAVDALRRQFVADAAHELRTPVAGLQALAEALGGEGDDRLPPDVGAALAAIRRESDRLGRLIGQLLALSRLDNPDLALERLDLAALEVVREAVGIVRPVARGRGVEISLTGDGEARVNGDPDWLCRAVVNVLDNAVRHSPDGGRVEVRVHRAEGFVHVEVSDRGPGVPAAELARLGERFVRLSRARERGSGGAGLGLAIVRDVVGRHGGTVAFAPRPGGGLCVTLRLPAAPEGGA